MATIRILINSVMLTNDSPISIRPWESNDYQYFVSDCRSKSELSLGQMTNTLIKDVMGGPTAGARLGYPDVSAVNLIPAILGYDNLVAMKSRTGIAVGLQARYGIIVDANHWEMNDAVFAGIPQTNRANLAQMVQQGYLFVELSGVTMEPHTIVAYTTSM